MSDRDDILRDVREVAREAGFTEPPPLVQVTGTWYRIDSLDAAWAEAEAALPKGAWLRLEYIPGSMRPGEGIYVSGDVGLPLSDALRALAADLRERAG